MKRLICSFDGTWNSDKNDDELTNVVKLHRAILPNDGQQVAQLAHYVVGIATAYTGRTQFLIGAAGIEVANRIKAGYKFLAEHYEPGDEIYLFGFSRGAFEARSLGGLIGLVGIGRKDAKFSLDEAWSAYRRNRRRPAKAKLASVRQSAHYPAPIKCIGVWDTVGNLGNPLAPNGWINRLFNYHDIRLPQSIDVALHALSIDEGRGPFRPSLWTVRKGTRLPEALHIEQVWFAGVHADVGGGYKDASLSDIGLLWMADRVSSKTGLAIDHDLLKRNARADPRGMQHSQASGKIYKWSNRLPFVRLIKQDLRGVSLRRRLVFGAWRTSLLPGLHVAVNESVHDSVLERFGKPVQENLDGVIRDITYSPRSVGAYLKPTWWRRLLRRSPADRKG